MGILHIKFSLNLRIARFDAVSTNRDMINFVGSFFWERVIHEPRGQLRGGG